MKTKLKPCPFCGREAKVHEVDWDCHRPAEPYLVRCEGGYAYIKNEEGCGAETLSYATEELAIAAWNRRTK
jgi:hypothetical protein